VVVAVATSAAAWVTRPAPLTEDEAVDEARDAFAATGLAAEVSPRAERGTYAPEDGSPLDVWKTRAEVGGEQVELWLTRQDGRAVYLDDRTGDGGPQLLTDAQFQALARRLDDPRWGRIVRRGLPVTAAGALVIVVALSLAAADRRTRRPGPPPEPVARPRRTEPLRAQKET